MDVPGLNFIRGLQDENNPLRPPIPPTCDTDYADLMRDCWKV